MQPTELASRYPRLFHLAEQGSWESIRRHGLLSTAALLDLFEITGPEREAIESRLRAESVVIRHPVHGMAVIRDQKPMSDASLARALRDGLTTREWCETLNRYVFFWLSEKRLERLRTARAYREGQHTLLIVKTGPLLEHYEHRTVLSPMNSGATKPYPHPRGRDTFRSIREYPMGERLKKRRDEPIVELAVEYAVPQIAELVEAVKLVGGGKEEEHIWP